jgi:hypothetical protein
MNANGIQHSEVAHASSGTAIGAGRDTPQLRVNVIATTEIGTIAALRTAASFAANLGAQITLIATEVVPWQLPLQKPSVPVALLERMLYGLVCKARIVEEEIRIQLCLCRDQRDTLRTILRPHSLVVIGEKSRWWLGREQNLKKFLTKLGHQVISVRPGRRTGARESRSAQSAPQGTGQTAIQMHRNHRGISLFPVATLGSLAEHRGDFRSEADGRSRGLMSRGQK